MGLSSSQARLLNLTARIHQIEFKAAKLEAQKLQMANDSTRVYNEYLNALETVKIQNKILTTDGAITYIDSTYNSLIGKKLYDNKVYLLTNLENGKVYVPEEYRRAYNCSNGTLSGFLTTLNSINSNASNSYISITTPEQLKALSNSSGNYRLDADITLTDWDGIENFSGIFDGNGHTVNITGSKGLFHKVTNATIKNVCTNVNINGNTYVGGLIGYCLNTTVENCGSTGNLTSTNKIIGGLIGGIDGNSKVSNSSNTSNITACYQSTTNGIGGHDYFGRCGGFIGYTTAGSNIEINDCNSVGGKVDYSYWQSGGFIGQSNGNIVINNCNVDNAVTVNYNGYGDSYNTSSFIYAGSTFVGLVNKGNVTANNCTINGSVASGGNTPLSPQTIINTTAASYNLNNTFSALDGGSSPVPVSSIIDNNDYPNLTSDEIDNATMIFNMIDHGEGAIDVPEGYEDSSVWLTNMINNGFAMLSQMDLNNNGIIRDISVSTDTNLQEIQDKTLLKKAEAKYEADMKRIDMKDRKYDSDLAALETEREAIKQEIETLKTVAKENIERTFRLFS